MPRRNDGEERDMPAIEAILRATEILNANDVPCDKHTTAYFPDDGVTFPDFKAFLKATEES